jgi:hypothetical protein
MKYITIILIALTFVMTSCKDDHAGHDHAGHSHDNPAHGEKGHVHGEGCDHDHGDSPNAHPAGHEGHVHGPNGGELKDISSVGKLEYILDEKVGTMTLHILGTDAKTPVKVTKAPQVIVIANGNRAAFPFTSEKSPSSKFTLTHDVFKAHMDVVILINLDGNATPFNVPIPHVHHH